MVMSQQHKAREGEHLMSTYMMLSGMLYTSHPGSGQNAGKATRPSRLSQLY